MRALVAAAALTLFLAPLPAGAALFGDCADSNTTTAQNFVWVPGCLRILSGDAIVFRSVDASPHNARSGQDDAQLLRLLGPHCFQTRDFGAGGSGTVRFVHDSNGVTASVRNPDGSYGPATECDLAVDPLRSTATQASIPFECGIHPSMTGRIVVTRL